MCTFIVVSQTNMLYLQYKQTSHRKPKKKSTQVTEFIFFFIIYNPSLHFWLVLQIKLLFLHLLVHRLRKTRLQNCSLVETF